MPNDIEQYDSPFLMWKIKAPNGVPELNGLYDEYHASEVIAFAKNTSLEELVTTVFPDKDGLNPDHTFKNPIFIVRSLHSSSIGRKNLSSGVYSFLKEKQSDYNMEILSITTGMYKTSLCSVFFVRIYDAPIDNWYPADFRDIHNNLPAPENFDEEERGYEKLVIPEEAYYSYTDEELKKHQLALEAQNKIYESDVPFLNALSSYTRQELPEIDENAEYIYNLKTKDMMLNTMSSYSKFIEVFNDAMNYVTKNEKDVYFNVLRNNANKHSFDNTIDAYIDKTFVKTKYLPKEDVHFLKEKLDNALFRLYIVQDLIDDEMITDIKITDYDAIRIRVRGLAYLSNVTFINRADYFRFINGIAIRNNIDLNVPIQTFTDESNKDYILRFTITSPYVSGTGIPIIHIRKISRKKQMDKELISAGMFDEKIRDYLLDCGKHSSGVVFAGTPGSGKTTILNWFLEAAYESSAEILVIQENDELYTYRKGVIFEHTVLHPMKGERACSLEELGQMALVEGANVFIIGEAKGAEICSALSLSNAGCRTAITIHSPSAEKTIDKMCDLAMRGRVYDSYEQAKRAMKSFDTIVYLRDYKVQEITKIIGYDEQKKEMIYKTIYRQ